MQYILHALDFLPVILAIIATVFISNSYSKVRRKSDFIVKVLMLIACILLIVAQTSWWQSAMIEKNMDGTAFANMLWLIFNVLVMIIFIIDSSPRRPK